MKHTCICMMWFSLLAAMLCGTVAAAETSVWGCVQGETAVLYLPETEKTDFTCQVGSAVAQVQSVIPLRELDRAIETVVLLDNSLSIQKDERPRIKELLTDLVGSRLPGEQYTIAMISDQVTYLCTGVSDYASLKTMVEELEFMDQRTQLTDGIYQVLNDLRQLEDGVFRRVIIIADGVDNKQIGYTQSELTALIQELGYPIYTVGCTNRTASATDELQNLFALSRLTSGSSYYLPEVGKTLDIVTGVTQWNDSVQVIVQLPTEVCDGIPKALRISDGNGNGVYTLVLKMPLEAPVVPEVSPEPETQPEPPVLEAPAPSKSKTGVLWVALGITALLVAGGLVAVIIKIMKRKGQQHVEEEPAKEEPVAGEATTEILSDPDIDTGKTEGIWMQVPSMRLIFQDVNAQNIRIEAVLSDEVLVGRDGSSCQVVLTEPSVARKQCRIFQQGGRVIIENLSRSNITKLNGEAVTRPCELLSGSVLQMGRVRLQVDIQ